MKYDRDAGCQICGAGESLEASPSTTLAELLDILIARFPTLTAPSIGLGARQLYARGIFEEETRPNLVRSLAELLKADNGEEAQGALLFVNDKRLVSPLRVRLSLVHAM